MGSLPHVNTCSDVGKITASKSLCLADGTIVSFLREICKNRKPNKQLFLGTAMEEWFHVLSLSGHFVLTDDICGYLRYCSF